MKREPKPVATGMATISDFEKRICALEDEVYGELEEPEVVVEKVKVAEVAETPKKKSKLARLNEPD